MGDALLQVALSNTLVAGAIGAGAWAVQRRGGHARLAHVLWVLVLVKLVTPGFLTLPVLGWPGSEPAGLTHASAGGSSGGAWSPGVWRAVLLGVWVTGGVVALAWSGSRVVRFHRLLGRASRRAPAGVQAMAEELSGRLGLRRVPGIWVTRARVSPLVWWVGGPVRVVLPEALLQGGDREALRLSLAHELAHVRRRDHWVRWLEWGTVVLCWWNPVAWLAWRNLRMNEEACCDALVLDAVRAEPRDYGHALLTVAELLVAPACRVPAVASAFNTGGALERRLGLILSHDGSPGGPRWLAAAVVVAVMGVLPLGLVGPSDARGVSMSWSVEVTRRSASSLDPERGVTLVVRRAERGVVAGGRGGATGPSRVLLVRRGSGPEAVRLRAQYAALGVGREGYDAIRRGLVARGVPAGREAEAMGAVLLLVSEARREGDGFALDAQVEDRLRGSGLGEDPVGLIRTAASRVVAALGDPAGPDRPGQAERPVAMPRVRFMPTGVRVAIGGGVGEADRSR